MYLTRFQINSARRGARKLLASPQTMHAAVLAGFASPSDHTSPTGRTLWRVDQTAEHQTLLYIASPGQPDLTHLVEQAGWPTTGTWQTRRYDPLLDDLAVGQTWAFRLTANPTHAGRKTPEAPDTQRFGNVTADQQLAWLLKRTAQHGFEVLTQPDGTPNLVIRQRQTLAFHRVRGQKRVTLTTVTYEGVLRVSGPAAFRTVLTNGIGHARAYGCGLITLAPPQSPGTSQ